MAHPVPQGHRIHLLKAEQDGVGCIFAAYPTQQPALCGQQARGNLITLTDSAARATCPRCLAILARRTR